LVPESPTGTDEVVDSALGWLAQRQQVSVSRLAWTLGDQVRRPRSIVTPLVVRAPDGSQHRFWLKTLRGPDDRSLAPDDATVAAWRQMVDRTLLVQQRVRDALAPLGVDMPLVIAHDLEQRSIVSTHVEGTPYGRLTRHAVGPRRGALLEAMRHVGRSIAALERVAPPTAAWSTERVTGLVARWLPVASRVLPDGDRRLEATGDELIAALQSGPRAVWMHGDLSLTNVLSGRGRTLSLIDFEYADSPAGSDIGVFGARLELQGGGNLGGTAAAAVAALVEGYGAPEVTAVPGFRFMQIKKAFQHLSRPPSRRHRLLAGARAATTARRILDRSLAPA
jgi:tRNA A-37 threonylcarbamoyl transferase component Bud32